MSNKRNTISTILLGLAFCATSASADTFVVTNAASAGAGSLREAINQANAHTNDTGDVDKIVFDIPRNQSKVIRLTDRLPPITEAVVLDGLNDNKKITIEGEDLPANDPNLDCLTNLNTYGHTVIAETDSAMLPMIELAPGASGSTIRNLDFRISRNDKHQIAKINALDSNLVSTLYNARENGLIDLRGPCVALLLVSGDHVIEHNRFNGFILGNATITTNVDIFSPSGNRNVIQDNLIENANDGIELVLGSDNHIARNRIVGGSMMGSEGIIASGSDNLIEDNKISGFEKSIAFWFNGVNTNVKRNTLSNGAVGVYIITDAWLDFLPAVANGIKIIDNKMTDFAQGVTIIRGGGVDPDPSMNFDHTISRNLIYNLRSYPEFAVMAVDLHNDGVTPNDVLDADFGENNLQNFPELTAVGAKHKNLHIEGVLHTEPLKLYRVEFFTNKTGLREGENYLGATVVQTDVNGDASILYVAHRRGGNARYVTSTATEILDQGRLGSTSEYSAAVPIEHSSGHRSWKH